VLARALRAVLPGRPGGNVANGRLLRMALVRWSWSRLARRLASATESFDPHVIVATQMNSAALLASAGSYRRRHVPTIGVPTDFGVHDFWVQPGVDFYCVAHESISDLGALGVDASKVVATGIPLMPGFRQPATRDEARRLLNIAGDLPVVLVAGGGLGLGVDAVSRRLLESPQQMQILVIAGENAAAKSALKSLVERYGKRIRVWHWVEHMELLIRAADLVVGKPGGLTVAEVLACGRPLIAARSLGGQEGFNVQFLQRHQVGRLVCEPELVHAVESLLSDTEELRRMQERAWSVGRREGAERIAALIEKLAGKSARRAVARR
jgi:processive 1,2-diacylglycerol beta-glucosyltransferase